MTNIVELPNGIDKPHHGAIFAPRTGPLDNDKARFWIAYPNGNTRTNARGHVVEAYDRAASNRRPTIITDDPANWSVLIERCAWFNIDPHVLFIGRPLRLAVEPYEYTPPFARHGEQRAGLSFVALHVGGDMKRSSALDALIAERRSLFTER